MAIEWDYEQLQIMFLGKQDHIQTVFRAYVRTWTDVSVILIQILLDWY